MLLELRVENLLLIERAELRLVAGLNVLTGETGAGKTVLAHALDLLLGGRARPGIVRPGADEADVEGVFEGLDGEDGGLARRVAAAGGTRAYVDGRGAAAGASEALAPDEGGGAATLLAAAVASLEGVAGVDDGLDELAERARSVALEADDVAAELRRYAEGLDAEPSELEAVEERLA